MMKKMSVCVKDYSTATATHTHTQMHTHTHTDTHTHPTSDFLTAVPDALPPRAPFSSADGSPSPFHTHPLLSPRPEEMHCPKFLPCSHLLPPFFWTVIGVTGKVFKIWLYSQVFWEIFLGSHTAPPPLILQSQEACNIQGSTAHLG